MGPIKKRSALSTVLGLLGSVAAAEEVDDHLGLFVGQDGSLGVSVQAPVGPLDVAQEPRTGAHHPEGVSGLYVTGNFPAGREADGRLPGVQFRHSNGSQGIGFGFDTIYATGANANQNLVLEPRGNGEVRVDGPLDVTGELTNDTLEARLTAIEDSVRKLVPLGTVVAWSGNLSGTNIEMLRSRGWITADGRALDRKKYADLFAVIGTAYGTPGESKFNIPDLRGLFVRGLDRGAGRDPDAGDRTSLRVGGNTGDNVGSYQKDKFRSHTHKTPHLASGTSGIAGGTYRGYPDRPTSAAGGNETRPKNVALHYLVRVSYDRFVP